jgi:hypothetical protein
MQDPSKFTQIGVFGLKINHLATLLYFHFGPFGLFKQQTHLWSPCFQDKIN